MRTIRPARLAFTAAVTLTAAAVLMNPRTAVPPPASSTGSGPVDTLITTGEPAVPTTSGGHVAVARDIAHHDAVAAASADIPDVALAAYQRAAAVATRVDRDCGLTWTLLAAVGGVESDHGRHGGAVLGDDGVSTPLIRGVALNGHGRVARVADTDGGRVDGDRRWDRAVGPMQFLPATWATVGVDADGDGVRSADDLDDAALGAAVFLCAAPGTLDTRHGMRAALHRYNPSTSYVDAVIALERTYRTGDYTQVGSPGAPVVVRAMPPLPTAAPTRHHDGRSGEQPAEQPASVPHAEQAHLGGGHQGTPGDPVPSPEPTAEPTPTPSPTPTPTPTPTPDPTPDPQPGEPTELTGILQVCGTDEEPAWCVDDTVLDVGDDDYLASEALADFDGDGTLETNADELAGLADTGTEITVTVALTDDAPAVLLAIGEDAYVADEETEAPR